MSALTPTDADLLGRFRESGDRAAFSALCERHRDLAYRVALRVLGSPADAEDAAQNALIRLAVYEPRLRAGASLDGLVARMAICAARNVARAGVRRCARETRWAALQSEERADPLALVLAASEKHSLREAVAALDETYRLPVLLHYFEGLSVRETAEALEISYVAARVRLSRALARLRHRLQEEGIAMSLAALIALLRSEHVQAAATNELFPMEALTHGPPVAAPVAGSVAAGGTALGAKLAAACFIAATALGGGIAHRGAPPGPPTGTPAAPAARKATVVGGTPAQAAPAMEAGPSRPIPAPMRAMPRMPGMMTMDPGGASMPATGRPGGMVGMRGPKSGDTREMGKAAYKKGGCARCHGETGRGDGPAGRRLSPRPTNFADPNAPLMWSPGVESQLTVER